MEHTTRLYLISPPVIDLPRFCEQLEEAFSGGDVGSFQLRLKGASDDDILKAAKSLIPICHKHEAAFILNDRADLAKKCGADGVHLGQDDGDVASVRALLGDDVVIGVSCHDSKHMAMEAGEAGADYVAFGAFFETKSKSAEALAKYGTPTAEILSWWQEYMVLPCVAIGGMKPSNCGQLARTGADFIAVITAVWEHPEGPAAAVKEFNEAIKLSFRA
ncbi:MAG: thiamine phosphate synthase [Alphaproteobacteria bacterium]|nr:thiamine phosphate synthase [Alphaproteobacteria bacterium]